MQSESAYPVIVLQGSAVLKGLQILDLPGRSVSLPPLYEYIDGPHPLCRSLSQTARVYVYIVDSSPEGKRRFQEISEAQRVPEGPIGGGNNPGIFILKVTYTAIDCDYSRTGRLD